MATLSQKELGSYTKDFGETQLSNISVCAVRRLLLLFIWQQSLTLCSPDFDFPPGCVSIIAAALESNTVLTELCLSTPNGNTKTDHIGIEDARALCSMLQRNMALLDLDLRGKSFFYLDLLLEMRNSLPIECV